MKLIILSLLLFVASMPAFARGSISKDQVMSEVCAESISLCSHLKTLNISEHGDGIRLPSGVRLMPFRFSIPEEELFVEIDRDDYGKIFIAIREID